MIIAYLCLDQIGRLKKVRMLSENHLTIRDYFNQLHVGKPGSRKAYSAVKSGAPKTLKFHQILISNQRKLVKNSIAKTSGLTIADYLANPVAVKCQYKYHLISNTSDTKSAKSDNLPELSKRASTKTFADKNAVRCHKENRSTPPRGTSDSKSSHSKAGAIERLSIEESIYKAARRYNLPPSLIRGVIKAESNFQACAVSHAGAQGLMQLMPATAKELGVTEPFDIEQNIDGGSRYLRKMLDNFGGSVKLALAAYNAGPGTVRKFEGDVPYQETKQYIDRVLRFAEQPPETV